eukprot:SAG22_NODE_478_length_9967_cov_12.777260_6_plen_59_part_00
MILFLLVIPCAVAAVFYLKAFQEYQKNIADGQSYDAKGGLSESGDPIKRVNPLDVDAD